MRSGWWSNSTTRCGSSTEAWSTSGKFLAPPYHDGLAADEQTIFCAMLNRVRRFSHDGVELAAYDEEDRVCCYPVLAPGGLLFCGAYVEGDYEQDEIIALDAQTLELRYRFGLTLLHSALEMVVGGNELFVCDANNDRLQVFSLAGEHRRSITGEWKKPEVLCCAKDRLYLAEKPDHEGEDSLRGRRIFVLSLQGDTLYTYTHPEGHYYGEPSFFDGKLLATHGPAGHSYPCVQALVGV